MIQEGYPAFTATTDTTAPTLLAFLPIPTGEVALMKAYVIARRTDGTAFATELSASAENDLGTPTLVGTAQSLMRGIAGLLGGVLLGEEPQVTFEPAEGGINLTVQAPTGGPVVWEAIVEMRRTGQ